MSRTFALVIVITFGALAVCVTHAQVDPTIVHIEKIKDNLYVIPGGRGTGAQAATISGNTTVFITDTGVVLIDTKLPRFGQAILDQVKSVTNKPVTTIINTHTHNDHTGSNNDFPRTVDFVAHENTKANMLKMDAFMGDGAAFVPKQTFKDRMSLFSGKNRIDLYYFGRGHTDGDIVIVFPDLRTAVFGDLFARKWAPLVDAAYGGSAVAFPQTLSNAIAGVKNVDSVITGHGTTTVGSGQNATFVRSNPVMTWADLLEYADFVREFVAAAQTAKQAGQTPDQAVQGLKLADKYQSYNMANARADVQRVYDELSGR